MVTGHNTIQNPVQMPSVLAPKIADIEPKKIHKNAPIIQNKFRPQTRLLRHNPNVQTDVIAIETPVMVIVTSQNI